MERVGMWRDRDGESRDVERLGMERVGMWESRDVKIAERWRVERWSTQLIADRSGTAVSRWCLGVRHRTKPVFSRIKWFPVSMGKTSSVRRVRLLLGLALKWSPLPALRRGDLWKIQAVPLCLVIQACSLHWNGWTDASSRRCLGVWNCPTKRCVFSASMGETRLCDGCGFYFVWRLSGPHCQRCAEVIFELKDSMRCAIVFGDPGLQFALEWLKRRVVKVMSGCLKLPDETLCFLGVDGGNLVCATGAASTSFGA